MEIHSDSDNAVISLAMYRDDMNWPAFKQMEAYWHGLRVGTELPRRADINPRGLENILEYAFVLERIAPGIARFRLAGMHLVELMGMEVKGMPLTSFFTPHSRKPVSELLENVFQKPETAELVLCAESGFGRPDLTARMLLLPLKSDFGDVTRILGCLVSKGPTGRAPRRFDLQEARRRPIACTAPPGTQPVQKAKPLVQPGPEIPALTKGFAEQKPEFAAKTTEKVTTKTCAKTSTTRISHLRLVASND